MNTMPIKSVIILASTSPEVGKAFAKKIPEPKKQINRYLSVIARNHSTLMLAPVTEREIVKIINKLPAKHSSGE